MPNSVTRPKQGRIALIDADGFLFSVACSGESVAKGQGENGEDLYFQTLTDEEAYTKVLEDLEAIVEAVQADSAFICLTDRENFRKEILPSYKGNRKESRRPPLLKVLRDLLQERAPFPVLNIKGLEADDVAGISSGVFQAQGKDVVICSPDKDLNTIPGKLYSCRKGSVVLDISEAEADRFHLYQTLCGDPTDGYTGCPKVGPVKAKTILDACEIDGVCVDPAGRWEAVVFQFTSRGFTEEYALQQARVARILRVADWDAAAKEPILWEPPTKA